MVIKGGEFKSLWLDKRQQKLLHLKQSTGLMMDKTLNPWHTEPAKLLMRNDVLEITLELMG